MICNNGLSCGREWIKSELPLISHLDLRTRRIMEMHVLELDVTLNPIGSDVSTIVVDSRHTVEQLKNTTRGSDGLHKLRENGDEGREGKH